MEYLHTKLTAAAGKAAVTERMVQDMRSVEHRK